PAQFVEIQRLVGIVIELQMVSAVAGFNELPLLRLRIVVRGLAAAAIQWEPIGGFISKARVAAPGRSLVAANLRRCPYASFAVEHRVMRIRRIVRRIGPKMFVTPPQRRRLRRRETRWNFR